MVYKQTKPQSSKVRVQKKGKSFQHYPLSKLPLLGTLQYPNYQHEPFLCTRKSFDRHRLARGEATGCRSPGSSPWVPDCVWWLLSSSSRRRSRPKCCQTSIPNSTDRPSPASGLDCRDVGGTLPAVPEGGCQCHRARGAAAAGSRP